eukprot:scaffold26899_cov23-Tisochrysis_lutea.AAC.1
MACCPFPDPLLRTKARLDSPRTCMIGFKRGDHWAPEKLRALPPSTQFHTSLINSLCYSFPAFAGILHRTMNDPLHCPDYPVVINTSVNKQKPSTPKQSKLLQICAPAARPALLNYMTNLSANQYLSCANGEESNERFIELNDKVAVDEQQVN